NLGGTVPPLSGVLQGIPLQLHTDHISPRSFHCLLNGDWYFTCFTAAETDFTVTISDNCQSGKGEDTTTFNSLGNPIDLNQLFLEAFVVALFFLSVCHILTLRIPVQLHAQRLPAP